MRRISVLAAALLAAVPAFAQQNVYSLPKTSIAFEVEAVVETFHAGPYAEYAKKYLGIDARTEDETTCHITGVKMVPYVEADLSERFSAPATVALPLTTQGLVALPSEATATSQSWKFPTAAQGDFQDKGVTSNFAVEVTNLYKTGADGETVKVQQSVSVEKTPEKRAAEAAEMILKLRKVRVQIITGDTDMTYSGEAMGAAVQEMKDIEKEYLSLFIGYTDSYTQTLTAEVIPNRDAAVQKYVVLRVSDSEGLVSAENLAGSPLILELVPEAIGEDPTASAKPSKYPTVKYRIPATCAAKLYDGTSLLLQSRIPVYQLGTDVTVIVPTK